MRLENIAVGDKLVAPFDDGLGGTVILCEVLKLGKVKVFVRDDKGRESWAYPASFSRKISDERYAQILAEESKNSEDSNPETGYGNPTI